MEKITEQEIRRAVATLSRSDRGRQAMSDALTLLDNGGTSLDESGQVAVFALLGAAWTGMAGTALGEMRAALADNDG